MLVAGSVLSLLLMGLAVDGVLSPSEEGADDDDTRDTEDGFDPNEEPTGDAGSGLAELLFGGDAVEEGVNAEDDDIAFEDDSHLVAESEGTPVVDGDFVEVEEMTLLADGEDVHYVEEFQSETDRLILEFDGDANDTPDIGIDLESEDGAAVVLANGFPVTLVEGATDMTAEQVEVVMLDELSAEDAAFIAEASDASNPIDDGKYDSSLFQDLDADDESSSDDADDLLTELDHVMNGIGEDLSGQDVGSLEDTLSARADMQIAFGPGGDDALVGTFLDDNLDGGDGQDAIFADDGDDTISGGDGNDELRGDDGDDLMSGGSGTDFLSGGSGDDAMDGGEDRDLLFGGDGDDTMAGGSGDDVMQGGAGADVMDGGAGDDVLDGTYGQDGAETDAADTLSGGDGDDTIKLGAGDVASGGEGEDTFIGGDYAASSDDSAMINDFDPDEDVIEITYDPEVNDNPEVTVEDFADGTGANIMLDGNVILSVTGAQGLDPNEIALRANA